MTIRHHTVMASIAIVCLSGFYSAAIPLSNYREWTVSSGNSNSPQQDDCSASSNDDGDDIPDAVATAHYISDWSSHHAASLYLIGSNTFVFALLSSATPTLESQHILL